MKLFNLYIVIVALLISSCSSKNEPQLPKIFFLEDSVSMLGDPDSTVLAKFLNLESDQTYLFNNMVSMTLILEPPAVYHCFIFEQVGADKQIYYLKMDDAIKYNWIPPYDSLNYDLGLDFMKTEMAGCTVINNYDGRVVHIKPDTAMKWSSKYEQLPSLRKNSAEYYNIVSRCDDIKELSHYYNNSLFFHNNSFVSAEDKTELLTQLIGITQIQYVEFFFDFNNFYRDYYPIIKGYFSDYQLYTIYKNEDFLQFKLKTLNNAVENLNWLQTAYEHEHRRNDMFRSKSRYLLNINYDNLNNILSNLGEIENLYNKSSMTFFSRRPHEDFRLFFFNIKYDENNKITIEKNYYNKEYITTTRIRGYY